MSKVKDVLDKLNKLDSIVEDDKFKSGVYIDDKKHPMSKINMCVAYWEMDKLGLPPKNEEDWDTGMAVLIDKNITNINVSGKEVTKAMALWKKPRASWKNLGTVCEILHPDKIQRDFNRASASSSEWEMEMNLARALGQPYDFATQVASKVIAKEKERNVYTQEDIIIDQNKIVVGVPNISITIHNPDTSSLFTSAVRSIVRALRERFKKTNTVAVLAYWIIKYNYASRLSLDLKIKEDKFLKKTLKDVLKNWQDAEAELAKAKADPTNPNLDSIDPDSATTAFFTKYYKMGSNTPKKVFTFIDNFIANI